MGFLKGQKAGGIEVINRKLCSQWRAEEGKSIKNEIQEVGGLDPPVPPPTHPFLTIKTETCIKNEECGNLTHW